MMNILVTVPKDDHFDRFFSLELIQRLEIAGEVTWNTSGRQLSVGELTDALAGTEVAVTGWHVPCLVDEVLAFADRLKLVAHVGGTVAPVVSEAVYARGIRVCSGNAVMARVVAEAILGYMLAGLRRLVRFDHILHEPTGWSRDIERCRSLLGKTIGFIGLGTVGRALLDLLRPFGTSVLVYDPYIDETALRPWPFAERVDLEECLRSNEVITIHAARTDETRNLLDAERLSQLRDETLLINAARGAVVDEGALVTELQSGRLSAVLDVFVDEPLSDGHPLRQLDNVILSPHVSGVPSHPLMAEAMVDEVERFISGNEIRYEIPVEQFRLMTR
jgi:phosphoglycerate dehydrogenase-like enzyme